MRSLSNEQYENILNNKIIKIDAEIAIIDEEIKALKDQEADHDAITR